MKKSSSPLLALFIAFMLVMEVTSTSAQTTVIVEPFQNVAPVGQVFTVEITIRDVQNLFAFDVELSWNRTILSLVGSEVTVGVEAHVEGVLYNGTMGIYVIEESHTGTYHLAATSIGESTSSFNGTGRVVSLTFTPLVMGSCQLQLQSTLYAKKLPGEEHASQIPNEGVSAFFSQVYLHTSPSSILLGDSFNISGYVKSSLQNANVTLQYMLVNEQTWHTIRTVMVDGEGRYSATWSPQREGTYELLAVINDQSMNWQSAPIQVLVAGTSGFPWLIIVAIVIVVALGSSIAAYYVSRRRSRESSERR